MSKRSLVYSDSPYTVAMLTTKTGDKVHSIGSSEAATALECFSKALQSIPVENWDDYTESISLYKVYATSQSFPFWSDLIAVDEKGQISHPGGSECMKRGAAVITLSSSGNPGKLLDFKLTVLKVQERKIYNEFAN